MLSLSLSLPAVINVGIGLSLFSQGLSRFRDLTILYVYLGYVGMFVVMIVVLFIVYTVIAYSSSDESELRSSPVHLTPDPSPLDRGKLAPSLLKPLVTSPGDATPQQNVGVELAVTGTPGSVQEPGSTPSKPKVPSKDSPIRWVMLLIFGTLIVLFTVVLMILVAI